MRTARPQPQTVLVTGASSGIGLAIAQACARRGLALVLVARRLDRLQGLAADLQARWGVPATSLAIDLARPEAAGKVVDQLHARGLTIDALVNNAGIGVRGAFVSNEWAAEEALLQLNVFSLTRLTKLLLPGMVQRGYGRILQVASTAAYVPGPHMALYYASKAYVLSLALALREELRGSGVSVTALCPGATASEFAQSSGMGSSLLFRAGLLDASAVAEAGVRGMLRGKAVVIPGLRHKLLAALCKLSPGPWATPLVKRIQ
jgi:short-subunit dehydrogenase